MQPVPALAAEPRQTLRVCMFQKRGVQKGCGCQRAASEPACPWNEPPFIALYLYPTTTTTFNHNPTFPYPRHRRQHCLRLATRGPLSPSPSLLPPLPVCFGHSFRQSRSFPLLRAVLNKHPFYNSVSVFPQVAELASAPPASHSAITSKPTRGQRALAGTSTGLDLYSE